VAAADVRFDGDIGEREYDPASVAAIPADGYSLGVGQMVVDLHELPWRRGQAIEVETDLGIGETIVSVPSRVCVEPDARARIGEVFVRGQRSAGIDPEVIDEPQQGKAPRLLLDSELDVGQLTVSDRPPEELEGRDDRFGPHGFDEDASAEERLEAQRACES
jgi:hypothetical protein